jgi:hypothetical protein
MAKASDLNDAIRDAAEEAKGKLTELLRAAANADCATVVKASALLDLNAVTKKLGTIQRKLAPKK